MNIIRHERFTEVTSNGKSFIFNGSAKDLGDLELRQRAELLNLSNEMYEDLEHVKCPNLCSIGYVKYYPDAKKALFDLKKCQYCKGIGYIPKKDYNKINKTI